MDSRDQQQKGFTLIELLVVIAIIGLLASIVLVSLQGAAASARDGKRDAEAGESSSALRKTLEVYYNANGSYPWNVASEGIDGCCLENNSDVKDALAEYLSDELKDPLYDPDEPDTLDRQCYRYKTINSGENYKVLVNYETGGYKEISSWGGGGISYETTEFLITNCVELQNIKNNLSATYYLANDVDCSDTVNWNTGAGFEPIGDLANKFTGIFDGQNYKITDLYINRPADSSIGLFGRADAGSEVKNVGLENNNLTGDSYSGSLVSNNHGAISNCYVTGNITAGESTAGLVAQNSGTITNCYVTGNVIINGQYWMNGGLVGFNWGTISNSYSTGNIIRNGADGFAIGSLVGTNPGTITNCYATGDLDGGNGDSIGGLTGSNSGTIISSYAIGNVIGSSEVGGLTGTNSGTITNSYATGNITGSSDVGGLIGRYHAGTITSSYWDMETSGQATSAGGTGKTTAEMKQQATFVGWDFASLWDIEENVTYPFFQ